MADQSPDSPHFNDLLEDEFRRPILLVQEDGTETEEDETEEETDEEEEEEEEEVLIMAVESPTTVSGSNQAVTEDRTKRRREDRGGIESGDCSQGNEWNRTEVDGLFCPICMDAWTNSGDHHISCLPCGHVYGFSCIKRWLQQGQSSGKCPQCNRKSSLKDVRKLFASRIIAIDEESQKKIRSLESKCVSLENKNADWCKKEAEWQKREVELHLEVYQLKQRTIFLERLLRATQSRSSEFAASSESHQGQYVSGSNFSSELCREGSSCIFILQKALKVDGARLFDVEPSSQIILMARRLPGIGASGTHLLTKVSLIHPHESEDILIPSSIKAVKDLHFSPFNHNLALFSSLGKKLSILSMDSNNVILNYDLPVAAWSCSWEVNSAHYLYAGLQNGSLLVFDIRQTVGPLESLNGPSCNPIHTMHSLSHPSGVRTLLSASSVGVCQWNFDSAGRRSYLVPETKNKGVCISLAYCPSSDEIVASFRPRVEMSNEIIASQSVSTPPVVEQGIPGIRVLLKKVGCYDYQKLGFSSTTVNDIRLPKSTIINLEDEKQLFASGEEVTCELILQKLPSFSGVQCLQSQNHPIRDVKYINAHDQGLLSCLSEDALQLFTANVS
ncbi:E3 ubiquitin-protein ligase RFWD3-like [Mangifera indica]|uniref:E3 ubiquitin-protein ligase RFWD3-like n=1 Tax=Mangifera indica TaxID=29780 RepID=UPI001CFAF171|nr:E3 ubiquitin-protein ligase RFWD3-like [Mangifera indica]XP_044472734.1 E3 ubiquitin-protein ligase RFWD3-like [Mangifera indica]